MSDTREILIQARALIEDPERWTQRTLRDGERRCAAGAIADVCGVEDLRSVPMHVKDAFEGPAYFIGEFNDTHSHAEVLAAFDKAIERVA